MELTIRISLIFVSLVVGLIASEIILRVTMNVDLEAATPALDTIEYRSINGYYTYAPKKSFRFINEEGVSVEVLTDDLGMRNHDSANGLGKSKLVILGDSFVSAVNTAWEDTVVGQLKKSGITTYNAGMDGFSTAQSFNWLQDQNTAAETIFLLVFYLGNDFRDNYWTNPLPVQKMDLERLFPSFADYCSQIELCKLILPRYASPYSAHPMGSYATSEIIMLSESTPHQVRAIETTRDALSKLNDEVHLRGGKLFIVGLPSKAQVLRSIREISAFDRDENARNFAESNLKTIHWDRPADLLSVICGEANLNCIIANDVFRRHAVSADLFYNFDVHWNSQGQRVFVEFVEEKILSPIQE